jgi:hypothetical protein
MRLKGAAFSFLRKPLKGAAAPQEKSMIESK